MRVSSVTAALCVSVMAAEGAGWCFHQAQTLRSEGKWLLARSNAQATEYARSFDDALATQQLETFAQRRAVLEQAHVWQRGQVLGILLAVVAGVCAWMLSVLRRMSDQLDEAAGEELEREPRHSPRETAGAVAAR